jgi:YYY domain-containing protein
MGAEILTYWLVAQLVGLAGLPLAAFLLRPLPDRGYAFARPLGLLLMTYLAWLLAMFGLAPFAAPTLVVAALVVAAAGVWALGGPRAVRAGLRPALGRHWRGALLSELVFLGGLLAAVWMRAHDPTPWGTERPMDFAFFNAVQRAESFPPADPWLAGFSINYYYFGYLMMGAMALLSGLEPSVAYNMALALIFGLTAQGVFGLISNLIRLSSAGTPGAAERADAPAGLPWLFPLLGVVFVLVAANQSGAVQVAVGDERAVALDGGQLAAALGQAAAGANTITLGQPVVSADFGSFAYWERQDKVAGFNWWWPSRSLWDEYPVSDPARPEVTAERRYTITEFPLFSFRLGDMHPHVMALPFGLLAAALACATLARDSLPNLGRGGRGWLQLALAGVVLGSLYTINSWDLPTYVLLYAAAVTLLVLRLDVPRPWLEIGRLLMLAVAAAYLLFLPFHLTFRSLVGGAEPWLDLPLIGRLTSILGPYAASRTGLHAFLVIFGLFALPIVAFVYLVGRKAEGGPNAECRMQNAEGGLSVEGGLSAERVGASGVAAGASPFSSLRAALLWLPPALLLAGLLIGFPLLALAGLGALALERAWGLRDAPGDSFALLLAALGCAVLFGVELVYIRDVFEGFSARMNTVFKFYYQVWLLWGALAPFALWWTLRRTEGVRRAVALGVAAVTLALLAGALVYPWLALGELGRGEARGLLGATPREQSPAGAASIAWLRREAPAGSVVLEAVAVGNANEVATQGASPSCSGSYDAANPDFPLNGSYGFGGISASTGLPTLLGWRGHQQQWRGGDPAALAQLDPRCADVDAIYRTQDAGRARELLQKYGVRFVYVGGLEQRLYGPESLAKFGQLGEPVFQQDEVTIYRVR